MRVVVTLDKYDGSKSKTAELDLDGFGLNQLAFMLMNRDVCGATLTKVLDLRKACGWADGAMRDAGEEGDG